ncbi:MAG: efflux RND transporter periplasmic adaptor subunit [Paludibacteraceae bacterium]|nr:efflux RND transporter periplasmic adaptor subunit [Paludibacteraceae bacterium]
MNIVKTTLAASLALLLSACGGGKQGKPNFGDNEYAVMTVQTQSVDLETSYPASVQGVQDVEIRPKISGFITRVNVREGQKVSRGQVLFVIDNETYTAAVNQAKASVNAATAQLATAQLTYDNSVKLHEKSVIGDFELKSASNSLETAKASLEQAKAGYASARQNLSFCYVSSPANGVVGELPYETGALVSATSAQPLTTVSDISTVRAYFSITERDVMAMQKEYGSNIVSNFPPVRLRLADGSLYETEGKIVAISGVIDPKTGSLQARAEFANPDRLLKSGSSAEIVIPHQNTTAIVIPMEAVSDVQDKHFVYVVGKDNKVKYTEVSVDKNNDGTSYIITSGLKAGDRIVASGITTLTDGMEIKPLTPEQYKKKLEETNKLGEAQGDYGKMKEIFSEKKDEKK